MINGNTRQNEREYKDKRKEADKIFKKGGRVLFKSKLEQMDIAYNKMKAKNFIKK